jgi:hypothetical protein
LTINNSEAKLMNQEIKEYIETKVDEEINLNEHNQQGNY